MDLGLFIMECSIKKDLSPNLELTILARLAGQKSPRIHFSPYHSWDDRCAPPPFQDCFSVCVCVCVCVCVFVCVSVLGVGHSDPQILSTKPSYQPQIKLK
jgi:hypothetical protein